MSAPLIQLKTNRGMVKTVLLSLITGGIYSIFLYSGISRDINIVASRYDGKKTMHYCLMLFLFSWLSLGIVPFVWTHRISARIGREISRRGIAYRFGAGSFWGWNIFGILLFGIGPFIYLHKLCKAMNLLSANYNING